MSSLDADAVLSALQQVEAPGSDGGDIVSLGYVKDVSVTDGKVSLRVEFPAPLTPSREAVADRVRQALSAQAAQVDVSLEGRIPASFAGEGRSSLAPGVKNFIAVGSGKGGVGKSTIAVNLAVGLARAGARVGLLDTDVYGPSVPLLMGVTRQAFMEQTQLRAAETQGQHALLPYRAHGVDTMSIGYLVEPDQAAIWRGPMVHGAVSQLLKDVAWGELDYLVIDLPPGTGDVQLTLAQNAPLAGAVLVATPQPVAIADARKALNMFKTTKTEVLGMVENMAYHHCRHCNERDDIFGARGGQDAAHEWGVPFLGSLPLDSFVRQTGDEGVPVLARDEPGPLGDALWAMIDRLTSTLAAKVRNRPRTLPITRS